MLNVNREVIMAEPTKISSEEFQKSNEIRQRFAELTAEYGRINFALHTLKKNKEVIENQFDNLMKEEEEFISKLHETYGVGNLNIETGEFTPAGE